MTEHYIIISIICFVLLIVAVTIFSYNKRLVMELQLQLAKVEELQSSLQKRKSQLSTISREDAERRLHDVFYSIINDESVDTATHHYILSSAAYSQISAQSNQDTISISNALWEELSDEVNTAHPDFKETLFNLNPKLTENEYRVCLLLKCGFAPYQIAKFTHHSQESVSSTRRRVCYKFFRCQGKPSDCDKFIASL